LAILGDPGWAMRPMGADDSKPMVDLPAKESVFRMNPATDLVAETASREEWNRNFSALEYPALPSNPHIKVEDSGRVGQRNDHLALHRDAVPIDFAVEGFAEGNGVRVVGGDIREPKVKLIKEMKASPVDQTIAVGLVFGAEKDRRSKDTLKA
jgi:hypothetical protein